MNRYRCPGADERGLGLTATVIHAGDCCERFDRLAPWQQARTGLRDLTRRLTPPPRRGEMPRPPEREEISLAELAALIAKMQARAARFPDEEPPGASDLAYYVEGENTLDDMLALIDLGRPYNLVAGYRRHHATPQEKA